MLSVRRQDVIEVGQAVVPGDPHPQVEIFHARHRFIEHPDAIKARAPDEDGAAVDETPSLHHLAQREAGALGLPPEDGAAFRAGNGGVDQPHRRIGFDPCDLSGQFLRHPGIVIIQERRVRSSGHTKAGIQGFRLSAVGLEHVLRGGESITKRLDHLPRVIRGAVVHHDHLEVPIGLSGHAPQRRAELPGAVVRRDDDAHHRREIAHPAVTSRVARSRPHAPRGPSPAAPPPAGSGRWCEWSTPP